MKKAILFLLLFSFLGHAQAPTPNIYGTRTPALYPYPTNAKKITVNAGLKINSTASGLVPPKMTTIQKLGISSPEVSEIVYDTDLENYYSWNGTSWVVFGNSSSDNLQDVTNRGGSTTVQINAESGIKTDFATGGSFEVKPIYDGVEMGSFKFVTTGDGVDWPAYTTSLVIDPESNFDLTSSAPGLYGSRLVASPTGFNIQANKLDGTPIYNLLTFDEFGLKLNTKRVLTEDDLVGGGSITIPQNEIAFGQSDSSLGSSPNFFFDGDKLMIKSVGSTSDGLYLADNYIEDNYAGLYSTNSDQEIIAFSPNDGNYRAFDNKYSYNVATTTHSFTGLLKVNGNETLTTTTGQFADSDLTDISALSPPNDNILQRKAGVWTSRTPAQLKTDLALVKGDVGLGNVDNTSDVDKPISTATATALSGKEPIITTLNVAKGGTGLSSLTAGRIPYGAGTSAFGNSASLFWDGSNNRLGIGTSGPLAPIHLLATRATATFASSGLSPASPFTSTAAFGAWQSNQTVFSFNQASGTGGGMAFQGFTSADANAFILDGNVGVSSPTSAAVTIRGWKTDGSTGRTAMTGNDKVFSIMAGSSAEVAGFYANGKIAFPNTNTASGTTGAQTINKASGSVNFEASASTLVVTNNLVSSTSNVFLQVEGTDATAISARVTKASGSFTITLNAPATAETTVSFFVIN